MNDSSHIIRKGRRSYFFLDSDLSEQDIPVLEKALLELSSSGSRHGEDLSSRGGAIKVSLSKNSFVIARKYLRGGFVRFLNYSTFFKFPWQTSRAEREAKVLKVLINKEVSVPNPRVVIVDNFFGGFVYKAYIVLDFLEGYSNFLIAVLDWSGNKKEKMELIARNAGAEAGKMLAAGIVHVDLHLGNVMYKDGEIKLIDFDKAYSANALAHRNQVSARWSRSVDKYGLPEVLSSAFKEGLLDSEVRLV